MRLLLVLKKEKMTVEIKIQPRPPDEAEGRSWDSSPANNQLSDVRGS